MSTLTVAACQFSAGPDPTENLHRIDTLAREATGRGARLLVFPEASMARFGTRLCDVAEPLDGPFARGIETLASQVGAVIVAGMFTPVTDGRVHNTLVITDGARSDHYDKIHLYDAFGGGESKVVAPGSRVVTYDAFGTRIGLATCYDVRFAAHFTALGRAGAEIVCLPASWGDGPGKAAQWTLLSAARAMDAQAVLVAADQALVPDQGKNPLGVGRSQIVGPDGAVLADAGEGPEIVLAEVDVDQVRRFRQTVPILGG